jgi:hypothetical protein
MGNIELFKRELTKSLKTHFAREFVPRALEFLKDEITILLDNNINKLKNDNTVQSQYNYRKGQNSHSTSRVR